MKTKQDFLRDHPKGSTFTVQLDLGVLFQAIQDSSRSHNPTETCVVTLAVRKALGLEDDRDVTVITGCFSGHVIFDGSSLASESNSVSFQVREVNSGTMRDITSGFDRILGRRASEEQTMDYVRMFPCALEMVVGW